VVVQQFLILAILANPVVHMPIAADRDGATDATASAAASYKLVRKLPIFWYAKVLDQMLVRLVASTPVSGSSS